MKVFWKESNFKRVLVGKVGRKLMMKIVLWVEKMVWKNVLEDGNNERDGDDRFKYVQFGFKDFDFN